MRDMHLIEQEYNRLVETYYNKEIPTRALLNLLGRVLDLLKHHSKEHKDETRH